MRKKWKPLIQRIERFDGRAIVITFKQSSKTIQLSVVYIPSFVGNIPQTQTQSKTKINEIPGLIKFINSHFKHNDDPNFISIIGGDWNATANPSLDRVRIDNNFSIFRPDDNPENFILESIIKKHKYIDIWRFIHPNQKQFTHQQFIANNSEKPSSSSKAQKRISKSRIDFFLINQQTLPLVVNANIDQERKYYFDLDSRLHHKTIELNLHNTIKIQEFSNTIKTRTKPRRNKRFSKEQIDQINTNINQNLKTLPSYEKSKNFIPILKQQIEHFQNIRQKKKHSPRTSLKHHPLHKSLKSITQLMNKMENNLELNTNDIRKYKFLHRKFHKNNDIPSDISVNMKSIYDTIVKISKKKHKENKQRHIDMRTKMFIQNISKHIDSILENKIDSTDVLKYIVKDEEIYTNPDDIENSIKQHYNKIYNERRDRDVDSTWDLELQPLPDINPSIWIKILTKVQPQELKSIIQKLPKGKAPGPSGITYEDLSILLHSDDSIQLVCEIINYCYANNHIPTNAQMSTIINLPKEEYKGNLDKLRPITLLETFRKLLSLILTKRITRIIDKYDLLKGYNYGFRTGRSTTDVLRTLRIIIDDAHFNKRNLLLTNLDIYKAYDTVPFDAIQTCCKRLQMPDSLVQYIHTLISNRDTTIITPFGETDTLTVNGGVPQGDALSPILWAIFYDPMLVKLQNLEKGYNLSNSNIIIPALAYADDITVITNTNEQLQFNLSIISSYLNYYGMIIRPDKSSIVSNRTNEHSDFPKANEFMINGKPINNIIDNSKLVRYLGVYWSLDMKHQKTIQHAITALDSTISFIKRKHTPGKICTYLINSVLIPRISYRLQLTPLSKSQLNLINSKLRALTRIKNNLPNQTPNFLLYDTNYDIKLIDFEQYHVSRLLNDLIVTYSRNDLTSKALQQASTTITQLCKHPIDITERPTSKIPIKFIKKSFIAYIANQMYRHQLQLQTVPDPTNILTHLTQDEYESNLPMFYQLNVKNMIDIHKWIIKSRRTVISLKSFDSIIKHIWNKPPDFYEIPQWYRTIVNTLSCNENMKEYDFNKKHAMKQEFIDIINTNCNENEQHCILPDLPDEISIWTDGSFYNTTKSMGSASIITPTNSIQTVSNILSTIKTKPLPNNPSSTRAELQAIADSISQIDSSKKITLFTDSMNSIHVIKQVLSSTNIRDIFKKENHAILLSIREYILKFQKHPEFVWIKSHNQNELNEYVDQIAKEAAQDDNIKPNTFPITFNMKFYYYQNQLNENYPTKLMKKIRQNLNSIESHQRIQRVWNDQDQDINTELSIKISGTGMCKLNAFDATNTREKSFRIKLLNRILPTLDIVKRVYNLTDDDKCKRCKKDTETLEHLFECECTIAMLQSLKEEFLHNLETRLKETTDYSILRRESNQPNTRVLYSLLPIDHPDFLKSCISKGIVHQKFYEDAKNNSPIKQNFKLWFIYTVDAWLSTFYKIIWKNRNDLTIPKYFHTRYKKMQKKQRQSQSIQNRPPPVNQKSDGDYYEVESILEERIDPDTKQKQYLIHWKGYNLPADHTWENASTINHLKTIIHKFEKSKEREKSIITPLKRNRRTSMTESPLNPKERKRRRLTNIVLSESSKRKTTIPHLEIIDHKYNPETKCTEYEVIINDELKWVKEKDINEYQDILNVYKSGKRLNRTRSQIQITETKETNTILHETKEKEHRKKRKLK